MNHQRPLSLRSGLTRSLPVAVLTLLTAFCLLPTAFGQSSTATLSGEVVDQNGAVIPGALVKIINPATAFGRETTSSDAGAYTFPLLPPGTYQVTVQRDGFSPVRVENVVLNVGDQKSLQIQLKAGDVNATVTVDSNAEAVRTDGSVGTVVDRKFVANIPLNGRSLQGLIQLTPGVVLMPAGSSNSGSETGNGQFSVNGQRTTANYFTVDGVSANTGIGYSAGVSLPGESGSGATPGTTVLGGTNSLVSLDALQEFRIETSTYAPEFGRTPGGQISLATRGGTNQFHGSASYYFRNEPLDANDWFANSRRQPKPKERQSFFGGVFGGPIKRDRLFFFGSYEGLRLKQPQVQVTRVPTVALRAQAVPSLRPYLNAFPLPNGQDFGNGTAEVTSSYSNPGRFNIFSLRLDARLTGSLTGFLRVSHAPSEAKRRASNLSQVADIHADNDAYTGGLTWVTGSRLTADVRVNYTRDRARYFADLEAFGGAIIPAVSDVFLPGWEPSNEYFSFNSLNFSSNFTWGQGSSDLQRQFNVVGNVGWSIGAHQLKLGVDYRRMLPIIGATGVTGESLVVSTVANIVAGRATSYGIRASDLPREPIFSNLSLFAQDTWHASRRLTLTYGMRFERVPSPTGANGRMPRTLLGIENAELQNPRLAPQGTPLFSRRFGEFAPRFGAAYQLGTHQGWETTLRGGAGIFQDLGLADIASGFAFNYPFVADVTYANVALPLSAAVRIPPTLGVNPPSQLRLVDPNLRMPYTIQWNGTLEQGIGTAQNLTVAYVGATGRRLLIAQSYNHSLLEWPNANVFINVERNLGRSRYDALQVQYQRRLRRGVQALASYTLGRSRDDTSNEQPFGPPASLAGVLSGTYGPSDFDVRHILSAAVTFDVPTVSGPTLLKAVSRDWGLDLLIRYQSAFPVSPLAGASIVNGSFFFRRPDLVPGQPLYVDDPTVPGGRRFNRAAFAQPAPSQQGNFPRNGLRGFPASQVDLALRREFKFGERVRVQLRGELFNLFNHPNFGPPSNSITDGLFGQPTNMLSRALGGLNALYQMGGPRSGELAVKLIW